MKKFRNILAMLMVFVMLVAVMPMNVFAEETDPAPGTGTGAGDETPATYAITITKPEHGSVTATVENSELTEGEKLAEGTVVTLKATPEDGYEFVSYNVTGADVTVTNGTFTMPAAAVTVTATFKKTETEADKKAKELKDAKAKAKEEVGKLANLSDDEKKEFTGRIDKASKIEEIQPIVEEANKKDAENKKAAEKKAKELEEAKTKAKEEIKNDKTLTEEQKKAANKAIDEAKTAEEVKKAVEDAKKDKPVTPTPAKTVNIVTIGKGTASVDKPYATFLDKVTVTATPSAGYVVSRIYYRNNKTGVESTIKNYGNGYYYGYRGKYYDGYYGDYYRYYSDYENNYYHDYSSYDAYLKDRHYSFWNNGYRYWDDYDYKYYNRYYDRYNDRYYDAYDSDYYRYYDDYVDNYYRRYSSYEDYLYDKHYSHYRDYRYYDGRYYNRYYYDGVNYTVNNTFTMPASDDVTVYVEFTDWSYYGYYYDDYYYYRYHRDKKDKDKEEEKAKEEEKVVEEKTPQVFEASATINVGSKVFTKVNKNVTTTHQMDVAAYVKNGRVMLPLRYVAEALGLQVSWVPQTKTVIIWDLTQRVEIPIKSNKMIVNGVTYTSDVKPEIKNSRTMLPIANVARALGLIDGSDIIWNPVMKQVKLTRRVLSK